MPSPGATQNRPIRIWRTTVFRLASLFCVLFALGVVALLGLVYWETVRGLNGRTDETLRREIASLLPSTPEVLPRRIQRQLAENVSRNTHIALFSTTGERVAGDFDRLPPELRPDAKPRDLSATPRTPPLRAMAVATSWGETLMVARDVTAVRQIRGVILRALVLSGALIAIVGLGVASLLSISPLRRLRSLESISRLIAAGRLDLRMPVSGRRDELDLFAATVNAMVAEIERLLNEVKSATDAAAHDLRTPLTRVRNHFHALTQHPATSEPVREVVLQATADLDTVLDRFAALLRISELESGARRAGFAPVRPAGLIAQLVDLYEPLAEEGGVSLVAEVAGDPIIEADGKLLFEAVSNLIDNAIKFSPPGGTVTVALREAKGGPEIRVIDQGPGIAPEEREAVLQRHHRGSNARDVAGSGLGLNVVAAIARLHRYALSFEGGAPGLTVALACWPHLLE